MARRKATLGLPAAKHNAAAVRLFEKARSRARSARMHALSGLCMRAIEASQDASHQRGVGEAHYLSAKGDRSAMGKLRNDLYAARDAIESANAVIEDRCILHKR